MGRISQYLAATSAADADIAVIVQGGVTKKIALSVLKVYMGAGDIQNNFEGTAPPAVTDDETEGYSAGSVWIDTVASPKEAYKCVDATEGAAIWIKTTLSIDELGSGALREIEAATAENNVLVGGGSPFSWVKKTLDELKSILGLGSAAYTASTAYDAAGEASAVAIALDAVKADKVAASPDPTGKVAEYDAAGNLVLSSKNTSDIHASGSDDQDLSGKVSHSLTTAENDILVGAPTPFGIWIKKTLAEFKTILGLASNVPAATAESDFIASGASPFAWVKKTLAEVKTILGLGTAAYTAATAYVTHALATAANDFLVASGSGAFVKKTLAETKVILNSILTQNTQAVGFTIAGGTTSKTLTVPVDGVIGDWSWWAIKNNRLIEPKVGDNTRVVVNPGAFNVPLLIGVYWHVMTAAVDVDAVDDLDTGVQAAGTDYYVYACTDGTTLSFKISANSTVPTGFDADHSRKIGGFHTLCVAVGTIGGHTLSDYAQKDILPQSIWDLKHRAKCGNNAGMVYDPKSGIWVDIYLASGTGGSTASVNGGTISDTRNWMDFVDDGGAVGKRLLTDWEFQLCAAGSNEETNIAGSADPGTTTGHTDTAGRRMISNIGCEDCCGVMWQELQDPGGRFDAAANHTHQVTVSGDPQTVTTGNPSEDVAPAWEWYDLPGGKGSLYRQGAYGDVKLRAGGRWSDATSAGSRSREADNWRWKTASNLGARFVSEPL